MKEIIKARGLCKSYVVGKVGNNVLKNINLDIYEGDFTVIMGSSGSGKSTLLYSISTMDKPTSGTVEINGKDITDIGEKEATEIRSKDISFIFQSMNLLNDLSILENITYCGYINNRNKNEVNKRALELLEMLGLKEQEEKYPSELSGGQQQRVAIARALINNPKIVFGDEPTGALNSTTGEAVIDILSDLNKKGQSIVMVTHDIKAAARASRLLYLKDGRIDGDLRLGEFKKEDIDSREETVFKFIKGRGW